METAQLVILAGLAIRLLYALVVLVSQTTVDTNSLPLFLGTLGLGEAGARVLAAAAIAVALILFAFAHPAFRRSPGQIASGILVGLLVAGGWFVTGYLGADDFNP